MKAIALIIFFMTIGWRNTYASPTYHLPKDSFRLQPLTKIKGDFLLMDADFFGNVFAITRNGKLIKYNIKGDSLYSWNDVKKYGVPDELDVSNPLKPLVLNRSYGQLVILDKLMIPRQVIQLRNQGILGGALPTSSYDQQIWIFDSVDFKLKKINDNGNTLFETNDWRMILPESFQPIDITDQQNNIFVSSADGKVYIFDHFGFLLSTLSQAGGKVIGILGNELYQYSNGKLLINDMLNTTRGSMILPSESAPPRDICIRKEYLFLLEASCISIFKIEKNP